MKYLLSAFGTVLLMNCQNGQKVTTTVDSSHQLTIGFYNVENLFDTTNDPTINDEDFLPEGKLQWDTEKYNTKLLHIAQVMDSLPCALPIAMGLCEIENRKVLEDLLRQPNLASTPYQIVHQDSPDERGIDVALLFRSDLAKLVHQEFLPVRLPSVDDPNTRDILYCVLEINGEALHLMVNHWPSRGGGQAETEINRLTAARIARERILRITAENADAKILLMGDFNDYPSDPSMANELQTGATRPAFMHNYMHAAGASNQGTHYYKGEWGALDQFVGSWSLVDSRKGLRAPAGNQHRFFHEMVLFRDKDGQARPNRTYVGDNYKAGYSDHLAIYLFLDK